jgi:hypothetical protein
MEKKQEISNKTHYKIEKMKITIKYKKDYKIKMVKIN